MAESSINTIFFDLGRVLVDFNHFQIAEGLFASAEKNDGLTPDIVFNHIFHPTEGLCCTFDSGRISPKDFYEELCRKFSLTLPMESFVRIWNEIFTENTDVTRMVRELSGEFRLFLISNTNPLHFDHIVRNFSVLQLFESWILSYEVGSCKPDERIYREGLKRSRVRPEQIIYIDDISDYIQSAKKTGISGIQFTCSESLKNNLSDLLAFKFSD